MNELYTIKMECPYCGHINEIVVEPVEQCQEYTEDCSVCCRPMALSVCFDDEGKVRSMARRENE